LATLTRGAAKRRQDGAGELTANQHPTRTILKPSRQLRPTSSEDSAKNNFGFKPATSQQYVQLDKNHRPTFYFAWCLLLLTILRIIPRHRLLTLALLALRLHFN
jgi:hypothetical protein